MSEEKINEISEKTAESKKIGLKKLLNYCPVVNLVFFAIGIVSLLVHIISVNSPAFADFITKYVASVVRFVLAKLTGWIPFSLAEMTLILLPFLLIFLIVLAVKVLKSNKKYSYSRYICGLLSIIVTFYSLFVFTLGTSYQGTTLYEKLGVEKPKYEDSSDLLALSEYLRDRARECAENITFNELTGSVMPYSRDELNRLLNEACIKAAEKYDFLSPMRSNFKDVILSPYMTYTHISGVYSYYTGESNINTNFPDYTLPYTAAHEMSHQRGIAREDEANFVAYLICMESDDNYIRYSAYLNLLEYVQSALYKADKSAYSTFSYTLGEDIYLEFRAYNAFFDKYRENVAANVSQTVNNTYLQSQGQSAGTITYSFVVGLAIAYLDY
ncbi:MAG: DUF3810 domain-containing protein [Ruminococcaceae bacterium]|nr:DUF3810 domain-containing protein [Oscillospiraceae bacterium]